MKTLTETTGECAFADHELDRRFEEKTTIASERLRRHLDECKPCRHLHDWMRETSMNSASKPDSGPPDSYRSIQDMLKTSALPVRALPSTGILVLQFWAVFLLFAAMAAAMAGIEGLHQMDGTQLTGMSVIFLLGMALLSPSLVWQMIPGSLQQYSARMIWPGLAAGFLVAIGLLFPWHAPVAFWARGRHCLGSGFLMSGVAAFLFWRFACRGTTLRIGTMGATLGASGGLVSVTALQFACSHQDLGHLFLWHGAVLVGSIIFGIGIAEAVRFANRVR